MICALCGVGLQKFSDMRTIQQNREKLAACRDIAACDRRRAATERAERGLEPQPAGAKKA